MARWNRLSGTDIVIDFIYIKICNSEVEPKVLIRKKQYECKKKTSLISPVRIGPWPPLF
jgi:hypothetical protein